MIEWSAASPTHLQSSCGRFTVAKVRVAGQVIYEAWERGQLIKTRLATADEAKDCCENAAAVPA